MPTLAESWPGVAQAWGCFESVSPGPDGLLVAGWMQLLGQDFSSFRLMLNGKSAAASEVYLRPDVAEVYPRVTGADRSGFHFMVPIAGTDPMTSGRVDVLGCVGDRPVARMSTRFRADLDRLMPTPPTELMVRVASVGDPSIFKAGGLKSFTDFYDAICRRRDFRSTRRLLDWGCGCGRVTAHFLLEPERPEVFGCDIDGAAIAWCQENLPAGIFSRINPMPPTPFPDGTFDVVIGYSVFTHLERETQRAWLNEIHRVLVPGGLLLATTQGQFAAFLEPPQVLDQLERFGILDQDFDSMLAGVVSDGYYRVVFQTSDYTLQEWSKIFDILEYTERGIGNYQDLIVMSSRG
jgi:SAM-dependent methyltransferase